MLLMYIPTYCMYLILRFYSEFNLPYFYALRHTGSVAKTDLHLKRPPGSAWRDADPDPGGKKA